MNVLTIYGNPKEGGFVHGCLDFVSEHLGQRGAQVRRLHLKDQGIRDCTGCFTCLRTGTCPLPDGMNDVCQTIRDSDCLVIGCSVRNGNVTALYKRFLERITYPILFTGDMSDKYVLSVSAVGFAGGRKETRRHLGFAAAGARFTGHLFFRTGIPTKATVDAAKPRLIKAADRLWNCFEAKWRPGPFSRLARWFDRFIMRKLMFARHPDVYAHVIERYKQRGWWK